MMKKEHAPLSNFLPQEIIRKKRDQQDLSGDEITFFIQGILNGNVSLEQLSAFAMAVFFNGMSVTERTQLTQSMSRSGEILSWSGKVNGPVLDKHSTGGIGDLVSLVLAPLVASLGGYVPMISGRGLGHTGGTLDKMDSIPGYQSVPSIELFEQTVQKCGVAIVGQTNALAPADRVFYAVRDVTATVESVDLITASILSKKLSAGLQGLVMDVKVGSGAFMPTLDKSRELANSIVSVANQAGMTTQAILTDMNQPLASSAGNALEVAEAISFLKNEKINERLRQVTLELSAQMLMIGKLANNKADAFEKLENSLARGKALETFARMIAGLGGPIDFIEKFNNYLPRAPLIKPVYSKNSGVIQKMDTRALGIVVLGLGGGRRQASDKIDYAVGLSHLASLGQAIDEKTPLAFIHAKNENQWHLAERALQEAIVLGDEPKETPPIVYPLTKIC